MATDLTMHVQAARSALGRAQMARDADSRAKALERAVEEIVKSLEAIEREKSSSVVPPAGGSE